MGEGIRSRRFVGRRFNEVRILTQEKSRASEVASVCGEKKGGRSLPLFLCNVECSR